MSAGLRLGLGAGVTSAPNSSCGGGGDERRSRLAVALGERAARRRGERRTEAGVVLGLAPCSISEAVADSAAVRHCRWRPGCQPAAPSTQTGCTRDSTDRLTKARTSHHSHATVPRLAHMPACHWRIGPPRALAAHAPAGGAGSIGAAQRRPAGGGTAGSLRGALCLSSPGRRDGAATRGVSAMHRPAQRRSEADCGGYAEGLLEGGGFGGWGRRELRVGEAVGVLRRAVCVHHTPFRGVGLQDCYSGLTHLAVCRQGAFAPGRAHHQAWRRQRGGRA